jgi:hypothetical protein
MNQGFVEHYMQSQIIQNYFPSSWTELQKYTITCSNTNFVTAVTQSYFLTTSLAVESLTEESHCGKHGKPCHYPWGL